MSGVMCKVSGVTSHIFFYKVVELAGGGSVINGPTPSSLNFYENMLDIFASLDLTKKNKNKK